MNWFSNQTINMQTPNPNGTGHMIYHFGEERSWNLVWTADAFWKVWAPWNTTQHNITQIINCEWKPWHYHKRNHKMIVTVAKTKMDEKKSMNTKQAYIIIRMVVFDMGMGVFVNCCQMLNIVKIRLLQMPSLIQSSVCARDLILSVSFLPFYEQSECWKFPENCVEIRDIVIFSAQNSFVAFQSENENNKRNKATTRCVARVKWNIERWKMKNENQ